MSQSEPQEKLRVECRLQATASLLPSGTGFLCVQGYSLTLGMSLSAS
jgi:hypothetical protein